MEICVCSMRVVQEAINDQMNIVRVNIKALLFGANLCLQL